MVYSHIIYIGFENMEGHRLWENKSTNFRPDSLIVETIQFEAFNIEIAVAVDLFDLALSLHGGSDSSFCEFNVLTIHQTYLHDVSRDDQHYAAIIHTHLLHHKFVAVQLAQSTSEKN